MEKPAITSNKKVVTDKYGHGTYRTFNACMLPISGGTVVNWFDSSALVLARPGSIRPPALPIERAKKNHDTHSVLKFVNRPSSGGTTLIVFEKRSLA